MIKSILQYKFAFAIMLAALFYMFSVMTAMNQQQMYKEELSHYDTNHDGTLTGEEVTPQMLKIQKKVTNDTAKIFAPYTLIPISLLLGLLIFGALILYQKTIYQKSPSE